MAKRIYDQSLGQLAGVQVTTDGLGNITRDGTEAYAQMVVSASGQTISSTAGTGNLVSLSGATVAAGSISFSANAQYAIIDTQGFEGAAFTVSGFGTATLAVQWSNLAASGFVAGTVSTIGTTTTGTTITANGQYTAASGGRYMKILVTAFTTGPIVVTPVLIAGSSVGGSSSGGGGVTQIQDGTASGNAAVKAASTAPIATDPALVVAISPNGQNANGQATMANSTPVVIASDQTTLAAGGNVANDAVDSGNPLKVGGKAATANPTAVAAADRVDALFDVLGKQIIAPALRGAKGRQLATLSGTTETTIVTAGAAGVFNDLYGLVITNTSASDVASVTIRDATAGSAVMYFAVKAGATVGFTVEVGSAVPQATAANNWTAQSGTSVSSLQITALYVATKA